MKAGEKAGFCLDGAPNKHIHVICLQHHGSTKVKEYLKRIPREEELQASSFALRIALFDLRMMRLGDGSVMVKLVL